MKNIKFILFIFIILFTNIFYVDASCTDEEINNLKKEAKEIKITYKHLKDYDIGDGETTNNNFEVTIKNLPDDLYVSLLDGQIRYTKKDEDIKDIYGRGTWYFEIYSSKCDTKVHEITVYLPRYNIYSEDPLCDGIDGDVFPLCGKYYEYDVSYETFEKQVKNYRATHEIKDTDENGYVKEKINIEKITNNIINYIKTNYIYFLLGTILIILAIIIIIILKKRKKRGVLK